MPIGDFQGDSETAFDNTTKHTPSVPIVRYFLFFTCIICITMNDIFLFE